MIALRGHHLLCLYGFRGEGYSPEFILNMLSVRERIVTSPQMVVKVVDSPDDICAACPHLSEAECAKNGEVREAHVSAKDAIVLGRLTLRPGDVLPARELFARTADEFSGGVEEICANCGWFPLGWCEEGIKQRSILGQWCP